MDPRLEFLQTAIAARQVALNAYRDAMKLAVKAQKNWEDASKVVDVARDALWENPGPAFGAKSKKR